MAPLFQFVMRSGPTPGATFSLEGDQLVIGRDSSSGVAINDAEISRKHARLNFQGGKYVIEDLGSTNGTFVNGQRLVSPVVLKSGDVVSLGEQIVLMYEALSGDPGETVISARKVPCTPGTERLLRCRLLGPQQYYSTPISPPASAASCGETGQQLADLHCCRCFGADLPVRCGAVVYRRQLSLVYLLSVHPRLPVDL